MALVTSGCVPFRLRVGLGPREVDALVDALAERHDDDDDGAGAMISPSAAQMLVRLLDPPPLLVGVSVGIARECQQNDSLADG